jgi:hypothetical protein
VPHISPKAFQLATAQGKLGAGHLPSFRRDDVDHAAERVRTVERRAGAPDHLQAAEVFQGLSHAVPFLGPEKSNGQVPAILQHQHPPVQ